MVPDTASGVQEFDAEPADTEANPLQSVRLTCRVRSRKGECVWLKNRRVVGKFIVSQNCTIKTRRSCSSDQLSSIVLVAA